MYRLERAWQGSTEAGNRARWERSVLLYAGFAAAVFLAQGGRPLLGPDHLSYIRLADLIMASCPAGDYWREMNSNYSFSVLLSYLYAWTGSHVLSMKIVLAAVTVVYLLSAELFFALFSDRRWQAILFALLSGFALSFGVSSWGVTDSTALLPRTFAAPIIMFAMWFWVRYDDRRLKYLVFPLLVLGALLHLSTYYLAAVLAILEAWDFVVARKCRIDGRVSAFAGALALAAALQFALESLAVSTPVIGIQIPYLFRSFGIYLPVAAPGSFLACSGAAPYEPLTLDGAVPVNTGNAFTAGSAREAWAIELSLRPWRNMPLPLINVLNVLSSSALILLLALWGLARKARAGFSRVDSLMAAMLVAVPLFAFLPQSVLWALRSFATIYPATVEEVRALNLVMVPGYYFVMGLFMQVVQGDRARRSAADSHEGDAALGSGGNPRGHDPLANRRRFQSFPHSQRAIGAQLVHPHSPVLPDAAPEAMAAGKHPPPSANPDEPG
jgi:hypothetical protein